MNDVTTRGSIVPVDLPEELTVPLPADASPIAVAARIAAETALGVSGVHHLGSRVVRAADRVRASVGRSAGTAGVQVDDEDGGFVVTVQIVVEHPHRVSTVADAVRAQVSAALHQLDDEVSRVDVHVLDVHEPLDDAEAPAATGAVAP